MKERNYLNYTKIANYLDKIFNKEGYDYYKAKKIYSSVIAKTKLNPEQRNDDELKVIKDLLPEYYKTILLPSKEDLEKALNINEITEKDKNRLNKLLSLDGIAYITKAIAESNNSKRIVYMQALSSKYIIEVEKEGGLKTAGKFINALIFHESLGHGALKHLEKKFFSFNPSLANILEDLVINIRLKRNFPISAEILYEVVKYVENNSQKKFPDIINEFTRLEVLQNKEKFERKLKEKVPNFKFDPKEKITEVLDYIDINRKIFLFFNDEINYIFNNYLKEIKQNPHLLIQKHFNLIQYIVDYYLEKNNLSLSALDNVVLSLTDEIFKITFSDENIKNLQPRIVLNKDQSSIEDIIQYESFHPGKITPKDVEIIDLLEDEDKKSKLNKSNNQTIENGSINDLSEVFEDEDFMDQLSKEEERTLNQNLNKVENEFNNKFENLSKKHKYGEKITEKIEYYENAENISIILSKLIQEKVLNTLSKKSKNFDIEVIPIPNKSSIINQIYNNSNIKSIPYGDITIKSKEPENENLVLSILDTSLSMSNENLSIQKSSLYNLTCKKDGLVVMEFENDLDVNNLKVLDRKRNNFNKAKDEWFKVEGRRGTSNFGKLIKSILSLDKNSNVIEKFKKEFKQSFNKDITEEVLKDMVENDKLKILISTDSGIEYTDLFSDENIHTFLNSFKINSPFIYIIGKEDELNYIKEKSQSKYKQLDYILY